MKTLIVEKQRTKKQIIKDLKFARIIRVSMEGIIKEKKIELEYASSPNFIKNCKGGIEHRQEVLDEQNKDIELLYKELKGVKN